ncbi:hypothetical protein AAF712_006641 [Marasmius tenuissimus]|uniref:Decapping nuclease n=1 Tax=Marasmius tenuissimus TaxID=585030 RepID=A0ABR2ZZA3_9AGAR
MSSSSPSASNPSASPPVTQSDESQMQQLGDCRFIAHIQTQDDGSYEMNSTTPIRIFPSSNENRLLDLGPAVRRIQKLRPLRFFQHPKHLDSIVGGCLVSENANFLQKGNVVLTWRGVLTRIFLGVAITLHVSYIDGRMYMEEEDSQPERRTRQYNLNHAVGMAFEDVYTHPVPSNTQTDQLRGRKVNLQWGNIVMRTLGDLNLIFCGEVDAVKDGIGNGHPDDWFDRRVELTCRSTQSKKPVDKARWHMQSALLAVPEIFVGYRDNVLRITQTRSIRTADIEPDEYESNIHRGYGILSSLRSFFEGKVREGGQIDDVIWKVTLKKGSVVDLVQLDEEQANRVKTRTDDPQRPIQRLGIIPTAMAALLRSM